MRFNVINHKKRNKHICSFLKQACQKHQIEYRQLDPRSIDFSSKPNLGEKDLLYRVKTGTGARKLELFLYNDKVTTFYRKGGILPSQTNNSLKFKKENLPIPKTIFWVSKKRGLLKKYVSYLGEFPLIIKIPGGQSGKGVIKIESLDALYSTVDYLKAQNKHFILKEFIESRGVSYRAIILGNKIPLIYKNMAPNQEDFRSNTNPKKRTRKTVEVSARKKEIITRTAKTAGVEFGGLDFTYRDNGEIVIFELNFPCNFSPAQKDSETNIASKMIEYLIQKSQNNK